MIRNGPELIKGAFSNQRKAILDAFERAIESVEPASCIKSYIQREGNLLNIGESCLDLSKFNKIYLIGFGKASVRMSEAMADAVDIDEGVVVGAEEYAGFQGNIRYIRGGHPVPDKGSLLAGDEILKLAAKTGENDLTFVLISGGGSSLVESPIVPLKDLRETTVAMMSSGADIAELNAIRKHLSNIKGGKLLKAIRGKIVSLIISDVVGNRIDIIASAPTYFDSTSFFDAYNLIKKYELEALIPKSIHEILDKGMKGEIAETIKEGSAELERAINIIIATNFDACKAAEGFFKDNGFNTFYLSSSVTGKTGEIAKTIGRATGFLKSGIYVEKPIAVVFGGESTVEVKGDGAGGRNQELVLEMVPFLSKMNALFASIGTDGIDGPTDAAGAIADSETSDRAAKKGISREDFLKNNDSYHYFKALDDLIITGPTGTNVADVAALIIL